MATSHDSGDEIEVLGNFDEVMEKLSKELQDLYAFRDLFFANHSIDLASEKHKLIQEKKDVLVEKFEEIDVERQVPPEHRAQFLYMKGRCFNIGTKYDARATQCLSRAVKLQPQLFTAWNELGESYWKNLNIKDAKASFEGALKHQRNRVSLRCLSIILRQECGTKNGKDAVTAILQSVEYAKEAVGLDIKDGVSWTVLGNAYLCQFFMVAQEPATLKSCMSAYKQAWSDPVARGQPDLYYNKGIALKYEELYDEAMQSFDYACRLDPPWEPPLQELNRLVHYLKSTHELVRTKGKIKIKKLAQMAQTLDHKMLGIYGPGTFHKFGTRINVLLELACIDSLHEGPNEGKVVLGRVVGSIYSDTAVPFTCAIVDGSQSCCCVTVYNWADGRGAIIGDYIAIPEPYMRVHKLDSHLAKYDFKSIRVNNPLWMLVNGKRVAQNQFAFTRVTSTYEIH